MRFEAGNILRRQARAGILDASAATLAHTDLVALPIDLYPYEALADRAWELRATITIYDATYVALAELLAAPLVTLDGRLARAPGARCRIVTYTDNRKHGQQEGTTAGFAGKNATPEDIYGPPVGL